MYEFYYTVTTVKYHIKKYIIARNIATLLINRIYIFYILFSIYNTLIELISTNVRRLAQDSADLKQLQLEN